MAKDSIISSNKRAYHDFEISDKLEVGIALEGHEVKSIRKNKITLRDTYVRIINEELWLIGCHITPYAQAHLVTTIAPMRDRKLLIHKKQMLRWLGKVKVKGFTILALKMYFTNNRIKLEVGMGKSKKEFDKRRVLKEKEQKREAERGMKNSY
ncbi:SsrA-binding protein [Candidatus Marinamargulisbacteria bacterium SCGC AAA071-K20]|nr:SsrA-binding protein [Candidatus Marinamargulisbacteria bacterium SCGC AAA071-K20]